MAENQLILGLKRQYGRTLGRIAAGDDCAADLEHLAAVIRMFAPDADLAAIKPIRPYRPNRSGYLRDALAVLRQEGEPMKPNELAKRVLAVRGVRLTPANVKRAECSLHVALERLEGQGVVREPGETKRWRIADGRG